MRYKLYWGLGILIVLLICAFVFVMINEITENRELKDQLAELEALENQINERKAAENNPPPAEPGYKWVRHGDHWDKVPTQTQTQSSTVTPSVENGEMVSVENGETALMEKVETDEVRISPFGFGPYPEVPEDMPGRHLYISWEDRTPSSELLSRVLIKLWTSGEKNFRGGSTHEGKIYPHYNDVVYVSRRPIIGKISGTIIGYVTHTKSGPHVNFTEDDLLDPPPHLRVLDLETSGINPYQYLDLPYKKGEK